MKFAIPSIRDVAATAGRPAPRIRVLGGETFGDETDVATLTAEPFELMRALSGRRSEAQIRAMKWDGDVDAVLPAFSYGPFRPGAVDIVE